MSKRKIIQITPAMDTGDGSYQPTMVLFALGDDGTVWEKIQTKEWLRTRDIPQDAATPPDDARPMRVGGSAR